MSVVGRILAVAVLLIVPSARADSLAFVSEPRVAGAGAITGPLQVIRTDAQGSPLSTRQPELSVRLVSDSMQGRFSLGPAPSGVWSSVLDVVIPADSATAPDVFYRDSRVGAPRIVATACSPIPPV